MHSRPYSWAAVMRQQDENPEWLQQWQRQLQTHDPAHDMHKCCNNQHGNQVSFQSDSCLPQYGGCENTRGNDVDVDTERVMPKLLTF